MHPLAGPAKALVEFGTGTTSSPERGYRAGSPASDCSPARAEASRPRFETEASGLRPSPGPCRDGRWRSLPATRGARHSETRRATRRLWPIGRSTASRHIDTLMNNAGIVGPHRRRSAAEGTDNIRVEMHGKGQAPNPRDGEIVEEGPGGCGDRGVGLTHWETD